MNGSIFPRQAGQTFLKFLTREAEAHSRHDSRKPGAGREVYLHVYHRISHPMHMAKTKTLSSSSQVESRITCRIFTVDPLEFLYPHFEEPE
jgi:hypothetical protein